MDVLCASEVHFGRWDPYAHAWWAVKCNRPTNGWKKVVFQYNDNLGFSMQTSLLLSRQNSAAAVMKLINGISMRYPEAINIGHADHSIGLLICAEWLRSRNKKTIRQFHGDATCSATGSAWRCRGHSNTIWRPKPGPTKVTTCFCC